MFELFKIFKKNLVSFKFYLYNYIITNIPSYLLRRFYLRHILRYKIGKNSFVHLGCYFYGKRITIGDDTMIGRNVSIVADAIIGNHSAISAYTILQAVSHDKNSPTFHGTHSPIIIDDYTWVCIRSVILPGSHIAKGVIIGANSTFSGGETEPYGVYVGSPARKVSSRNPEGCVYEINYTPMFH